MSTTTIPAEIVQSNDSANMNDSITSTSSSNSQNRFITEPILYKTKMCRNFMRDGYCYYENKCMFAHGTFDVRNVDQNVQEGLTSEEKVKRFQTRSIIMLKQKTRKEQPPAFQDAVVQVAENVKPQPAQAQQLSTVSNNSNNNSMSPTSPPTQCASNADQPATPPTKFSPAPAMESSAKQQHQHHSKGAITPEPQGDALIDIFPSDDESGNYQPQVISSTHNIHKYGYGSEPPSLNGSMSTSSMYSYGGPYSAPYGAQYSSGYGYDYNTGYGTPQPGYAPHVHAAYPTAPQSSGYCECHSCHEAQRSMSQSLTSMHLSFTADDAMPSPSYYPSNSV